MTYLQSFKTYLPHYLFICALLAMFLPPTYASQDPPIKAFNATYDVLRNGEKIGESKMSLHAISDRKWQLETKTDGTHGLAALLNVQTQEKSVFTWQLQDNLPLPYLLTYSYMQKAAWKKKKVHLRHNINTHKISSAMNDDGISYLGDDQTIDRQTVLLALATAMQNKKELTFSVAEKDRLSTQRYHIMPPEKISVPAGEYLCEHLTRIRENNKRTTDIWLAKNLSFLPVQILQTEKDDDETITMQLKEIHWPNKN